MCNDIIQALKQKKLFLFDMDGTIYRGNQLFSFTKALLAQITQMGAGYRFMTNNSSKSVTDYIKKMDVLGIETCHNDFITSGQATAYYLRQNHPNSSIYVCGTASFKKELEQAGLFVTDDIEKVDCIVMAFDTELTFKKIDDVCRILTSRDVCYIATHPDSVCPTEYGSVPDCGSLCDMVYNATGKRPVVIGKPGALMPHLAMSGAGCTSDETAVIGDRISTDIMSGINAGAYSILVMTGETTEEMLAASPKQPDLVLSDCDELLKILRQAESSDD